MNENFEILISSSEIQSRIKTLGLEIAQYAKMSDAKNLHMLWIAEGAMFFAADLAREIEFPLSMSSIKVSSYENQIKATKEPEFSADFTQFSNCDIILVDDILDTGATFSAIINALKKANVRTVATCVLLNKKIAEKKFQDVDFIGFEIEDRFALGYGLDYKSKYRNLRDIYALPKQ